MFKNLDKFLKSKEARIKRLSSQPLILNWLTSHTMKEALTIIDKKVAYLLQNQAIGGEGKLNQWLLSSDIDLATISAERYIIDYLKLKNLSVYDNLGREGIDARLSIGGQNIGIEITTLNSFIAEWVFTERLMQLLVAQNALTDRTLRVTHSPLRLCTEFRGNKLKEYIEQAAKNIISNDRHQLNELDINIEIDLRWSGSISWEMASEDDFPWLRFLTEDLFYRITTPSKKRQLNENPKNLIFVGVNNIAPSNWAIPSIFEEIGRGGVSYTQQIDYINEFWKEALQPHNNILGICYFCHSLDSEGPFYPLGVFWRDDADQIPINL